MIFFFNGAHIRRPLDRGMCFVITKFPLGVGRKTQGVREERGGGGFSAGLSSLPSSKTQVSVDFRRHTPRRRHAYLCEMVAPRWSPSPLLSAPSPTVSPHAPAPRRRSSLTSEFKAGIGRARGPHRLFRN